MCKMSIIRLLGCHRTTKNDDVRSSQYQDGIPNVLKELVIFNLEGN